MNSKPIVCLGKLTTGRASSGEISQAEDRAGARKKSGFAIICQSRATRVLCLREWQQSLARTHPARWGHSDTPPENGAFE